MRFPKHCLEHIEDNFLAQTKGMVMLLLWWSAVRKYDHVSALSTTFLDTFFQRTPSVEQCGGDAGWTTR